MTVNYKILQNRSADALEKAVNKRLNEGWRLIGGVAIRAAATGNFYCQAMLFNVTTEQERKKTQRFQNQDSLEQKGLLD